MSGSTENVSYSYTVVVQVFALGNKTYEHYNAVGKFVDKKLEELGAERVFELGLGDDDAKLVMIIINAYIITSVRSSCSSVTFVMK